MQAVILAAGKSTRTYPLTVTRPKPLLKAANKAILGYNLEALKDFADEIIIVLGYKKDMIHDFIRKDYPDLNVKFVEQKEQLGTGHAISNLKDIINGKFILLMGDNIYSKKDIKEISKYEYSILIKSVRNPELFGVVTEKNGILADIIEKPREFISDVVSCALYSFGTEIFDAIKKLKKSKRGEYEITDAIKEISSRKKTHCVKSSSCFQISYPWDLLEADKKLRNGRNMIGKGSIIGGKVTNSSVGDNCVINGNVKNSIVFDGTMVNEGSVIEDSILGENVHLDGKIISGNNVYSDIKNRKAKVDKFGAVVGDNVKAIGVEIKPGSKIWPNKRIDGNINGDIR